MATQTKLKINIKQNLKSTTFGAIILHNEADKISGSTLLGRGLVDWVGFACGDIPKRVIRYEGKINILQFVADKINTNYDYLIVLLSITPLISQSTIKEIIEYASIKDVTLCKLPVGYVIKTADFVQGKRDIDSVYSMNMDDFYLVENKRQLNHAVDVLQARINDFHASNGVEFKKPKSVYIEPEVDIAEGVVIYPNNSIKGASKIARGVILKENNVIEQSSIGTDACISGSVIHKSIIGDNVYIASFCEINNSLVGKDAIIDKGCKIANYNIAPSARIRANEVLGDTNDSDSRAGESR